jgi:hypothetical protein
MRQAVGYFSLVLLTESTLLIRAYIFVTDNIYVNRCRNSWKRSSDAVERCNDVTGDEDRDVTAERELVDRVMFQSGLSRNVSNDTSDDNEVGTPQLFFFLSFIHSFSLSFSFLTTPSSLSALKSFHSNMFISSSAVSHQKTNLISF